jgi:hypothetical protein
MSQGNRLSEGVAQEQDGKGIEGRGKKVFLNTENQKTPQATARL